MFDILHIMERIIDDSPAVLATLDERVAPVSAARERTLPVPRGFAGLFPEGALVRGRSLSIRGRSATSVALSLAAPSIAAGSWMVTIDVPQLGLDAAAESGIPLDRVVRVDTTRHASPAVASTWAECVAAACDGFDVLLAALPPAARRLAPATARKVLTRVRQRGVILFVLGEPGPLECDGVVEGRDERWSGLGVGHGHLRRRQLEVTASGRRIPGVRRCAVELPVADPGTPCAPTVVADDDPERSALLAVG